MEAELCKKKMKGRAWGWLCGFANSGHGGNPLVVEARALRDSLRLAWDKGYKWIEGEVDNLELVAAVEGEGWDSFVPEIREIKSLMARQWQVSLRGINREANRAADFIAKASFTHTGFRVLLRPCYDLEVLVLRDAIGAC
ncbi:uncharacterized protein LOC130737091 [Lotus japonicus]|uniref:uncharacterized protein LOC130737091 n=1 Tax=Lotus japonicus TaxID=34305 RepID=UPI002590CF88|nr:uncharacterized protein LOC130737091 [Lotus japonicus]